MRKLYVPAEKMAPIASLSVQCTWPFKRRQRGQSHVVVIAIALTLALALWPAWPAHRTGDPPEVFAPTALPCEALPPMPEPPADARVITEFGVRVNEVNDSGPAIQRALDAMTAGQALLFPPGTYRHGQRLVVRVPGVRLFGKGARLHATQAADQAVMLSADGASLYGFTLTAVTDKRRSAPWDARVAIFPGDGGTDAQRLQRGNVVRGNRIVAMADEGLSDSASSAGIFVYRAHGFLVADNTVERSLADGIHITAGSAYGRVLRNVVRETGDDMIGVVSYLGRGDWASESAATIAADLPKRRALQRVHDVLVAGNDVSGAYWGRGISVVGGRNLSVRANRIGRTAMAAGIYVAREVPYVTFGVSDVRIEHNAIEHIQTRLPAYVSGGIGTEVRKTHHGAIEIYGQAFDDEAALAALQDDLQVQNIVLSHNAIHDSMFDGVRIGVGGEAAGTMDKRADGKLAQRRFGNAAVGAVWLFENRFSDIGGKTVNLSAATRPPSAAAGDGVRGARLSCSPAQEALN